MPTIRGIAHEECYLPPAKITIRSLAQRYLCEGVKSACWRCECADHCEYGCIYCRMLRERVKAQKKGWRGYEQAARPLIMEELRRERKRKENTGRKRDEEHGTRR